MLGLVVSDFSRMEPNSCFRKLYGNVGPYYLIEYELDGIFQGDNLKIRTRFQGQDLDDGERGSGLIVDLENI